MTNRTTDKKNDHKNTDEIFDNVFMPLPPLDPADPLELEVYARFMRHVRLVPHSRADIKVLSAIQFTADMMDLNDAIVSRMLADMGLRGPRGAFPQNYLDHVDQNLTRSGWEFGAPSASSIDMKRFWDDIGEDGFALYRRLYADGQENARA